MSPKQCLILLVLVVISTSVLSREPDLILKGTVVTPLEIIDAGFVSIEGVKISDVGPLSKAKEGRSTIETSSFILPGLIDIHDHITWNLLPRWKPNRKFANRYEWQADTAYKIALDTPHRNLVQAGLGCYANLFGEVKALVNGATSVVGSLAPEADGDNACIAGNARNLDFGSGLYAHELNREPLRNEVFPLEIPYEDAAKIRADLKSGAVTSLLVHLAEGKPTDAASAREFEMLQARGFLRSGVSIIHGVALGRLQFKKMAQEQVGLIWSPRSNIELYGATTDVLAAKQEGVRIALAPDWSPSGSEGILGELKYAAAWNAGQQPPVFADAELVGMATVVAAQLAHVDDKIGSIRPGLYADLLLLRKSGETSFRAVTHVESSDIRLIMVGGVALYGDEDLMRRLVPAKQLEQVRICGKPKALHVQLAGDPAGRAQSWEQVTATLDSTLNAWGTSLANLTVCEASNQN